VDFGFQLSNIDISMLLDVYEKDEVRSFFCVVWDGDRLDSVRVWKEVHDATLSMITATLRCFAGAATTGA